MAWIAFTLWGSTLIPWLLTTNPSSFLDCAPNEHFTWFYFNRYLLNLSNNFFKFWQWSSLYLDLAIILSIYTLIFFIHHIVEQSYHCPFISDPNVYQFKWHHLITKGSSWSNKGCLFFFFFIFIGHFDLIVPKETIHERIY